MPRIIRLLAPFAAIVLVAAGLSVSTGAAPANAAAPASGRFTPVAPKQAWTGSVGTSTKTFALSGVPTSATAAAVTIKVTSPSATGYVSLAPAGSTTRPATQNFTAHQSIAATTTVAVVGGKAQVRLSAGSASVSVFLAGWYGTSASASTFTPVPNQTVFNDSIGTTPTAIPLAGRAGIPADATAVALNVDVSRPTAIGTIRVTPSGSDPAVVTQTFTRGKTITNQAVVQLSGGAVQTRLSAGTATVLMDVVGYYSPSASGSVFVAADPVRASTSTVTNANSTVKLSGTAGIPRNATGVMVNAKIGSSTANGAMRLTAPGASTPAPTLVYAKGQTIANLVTTPLDASGTVVGRISAGSAQMYVDVVGYFLDGTSGSGVGADISWPQGAGPYPTDQSFGIVGVNDVNANTTNGSFARQLAWAKASAGGTAQPKAQLYILTANPGPTFGGQPVASWPKSNQYPAGTTVSNPYGTCTAKSPDTLACGYMYGWARAYDDVSSRGVDNPAQYTWWLDVEYDAANPSAGPTWQLDDQAQNRTVLEGFAASLRAAGASYGIYSTNSMWQAIAGTVSSSSKLRTVPNWIPIGSSTLANAQKACAGTPLMSGSIAMTQYVSGGFDRNWSCR